MSRARDLVRLLPDVPRYLEIRAILLSGRCEIFGFGRDVIVMSEEAALAGVIGRPRPASLKHAFSRTSRSLTVLAEIEARDLLQDALPEWQWEVATISITDGPPADEAKTPRQAGQDEIGQGEVRLLRREDHLDHLDPSLRQEILHAKDQREIWAGFESSNAVCFAYSPWETETLADISIDTWEPFRGRGWATATVQALVRAIYRRGKTPVWGAVQSNEASHRLALRLGFRPVDQLLHGVR